jgi:hypothetical protein
MKRKYFIIVLLLILASHFILQTISQNKGEVLVVDANNSKGFNFEYYLYIPEDIDKSTTNVILVEPNNTGMTSDSHKVHLNDVKDKIKKGTSKQLADEINAILLVPVFDRPASEWEMYTHALDRDTLLRKQGKYSRLDLQLMQMIDDAKKVLYDKNIKVEEKVLMNGFSASGNFVNRFTALHPHIVKAVAAGGVNCMPILPVENYMNEQLIYPIGIADLQNIIGETFNYEKYKSIPQFIYMGSIDDNDTLPYDDAFSDFERELIIRTLGEEMHLRWEKSIKIYEDKKINAILKMYTGIGHTIDSDVFSDLKDFFLENMH